MKKRISLYIIIFCLVLMGTFAYSYIMVYRNNISALFDNKRKSEASTSDIIKVSEGTEVILETYDSFTGEVYENSYEDYKQLIGKTREEVETYVTNLNNNLNESDKSNGCKGFQMVYFSEDNVTIRKCFDSSEVKYEYLIGEENGYIIIYSYPEKIVYHNTGILLISIDPELQEKVKDKIYVKDINELYNYLESFTS